MKLKSLKFDRGNWLKTVLSVALAMGVLLGSNAYAAQEDLYSWSWWSSLSGQTSGTTVDIIYTYLGTLGYTGTINDRLHDWLRDQTGLPTTYTINDLAYAYFVLRYGANDLTFLRNNVDFLGQPLTFSH